MSCTGFGGLGKRVFEPARVIEGNEVLVIDGAVAAGGSGTDMSRNQFPVGEFPPIGNIPNCVCEVTWFGSPPQAELAGTVQNAIFGSTIWPKAETQTKVAKISNARTLTCLIVPPLSLSWAKLLSTISTSEFLLPRRSEAGIQRSNCRARNTQSSRKHHRLTKYWLKPYRSSHLRRPCKSPSPLSAGDRQTRPFCL